MKQGSNTRRPRGRNNNGKRTPNRNSNYDSGGSDGRIRGNASQVHERYLALARDALLADDRISSENYSQHAEHFHRMMVLNAENQSQKDTQKSSTVRTNKVEETSEPIEQGNETQAEEPKKKSPGRRSKNNGHYDKLTSDNNSDTNIESPVNEDQPNITETIEIEPNAKISVDVADI